MSQIGSSPLPPPFRGLHSPGVRKHCHIIFACYFRKSCIERPAGVLDDGWGWSLTAARGRQRKFDDVWFTLCTLCTHGKVQVGLLVSAPPQVLSVRPSPTYVCFTCVELCGVSLVWSFNCVTKRRGPTSGGGYQDS